MDIGVSRQEAAVDASRAPAEHDKRWWVLAILGIAQLMVVLDATVVNIALPHAQTALGFSNSDRQWIITAYSLSFGSLLLLGGRIADLFGRKRVFITGLIGFALASAIGGAALNFGMLVTARAVQGAFGALLAPAALSLLTTTFTQPKERAKAFGIYGAIAGAGASLGLLLGGFLTEYLSWRWTMYVNVIFAVIAVAGGLLLLSRHEPSERPRLDLVGTVLVSAGLFGLVYGFSHAATVASSHPGNATSGWTNGTTLGFLIGGALLVAAFLIYQSRAAHPLMPLRIIGDRNRGGANLSMFLASVGMFGVFLFLTYYLEDMRGYSPVGTGVAFLPMTGTLVVVASIGSTILAPRVSARLLIPLGLVVAAVGLGVLTRIGLHTNYDATVLPAIMIMGVGLGLVFAPAFSLGTMGVQAEDSGVASATVNVNQQVGGAIGTALLNTVAITAASSYAAAHIPANIKSLSASAARQAQALVTANSQLHSYVTAFWWSAAIFILAAVLAVIILRSGLPQQEPAEPTPAEPTMVS